MKIKIKDNAEVYDLTGKLDGTEVELSDADAERLISKRLAEKVSVSVAESPATPPAPASAPSTETAPLGNDGKDGSGKLKK